MLSSLLACLSRYDICCLSDFADVTLRRERTSISSRSTLLQYIHRSTSIRLSLFHIRIPTTLTVFRHHGLPVRTLTLPRLRCGRSSLLSPARFLAKINHYNSDLGREFEVTKVSWQCTKPCQVAQQSLAINKCTMYSTTPSPSGISVAIRVGQKITSAVEPCLAPDGNATGQVTRRCPRHLLSR